MYQLPILGKACKQDINERARARESARERESTREREIEREIERQRERERAHASECERDTHTHKRTPTERLSTYANACVRAGVRAGTGGRSAWW
jgi:hypothetical protein